MVSCQLYRRLYDRGEKEIDTPTLIDESPMAQPNPEYRFYCHDDRKIGHPYSLLRQYSWSIWTPSRLPALPPGLPDTRLKLKFHFRWLVSLAYRFAKLDCGALLIHHRGQVVHYSGFTPRYWRFPFVADEDLQIGDTWTAPTHRGNGLAFFALCTIVAITHRPGRRFWYVVENVNQPSIRVVEKAGFDLFGRGTWIKPWGLKLLGSFVMLDHLQSSSSEDAKGASVSL
jgi:RimJ/RimL family protein N-acetyltransferase